MPIVLIFTNVPQADVPQNVLLDINNGVGEILGIDAKAIQVVLNAGCPMIFGAAEGPTAAAYVYAAGGKLTPQTNDDFAAKLTDLILSKLAVPKERFYMLLNDVPLTAACHMGSTIAGASK